MGASLDYEESFENMGLETSSEAVLHMEQQQQQQWEQQQQESEEQQQDDRPEQQNPWEQQERRVKEVRQQESACWFAVGTEKQQERGGDEMYEQQGDCMFQQQQQQEESYFMDEATPLRQDDDVFTQRREKLLYEFELIMQRRGLDWWGPVLSPAAAAALRSILQQLLQTAAAVEAINIQILESYTSGGGGATATTIAAAVFNSPLRDCSTEAAAATAGATRAAAAACLSSVGAAESTAGREPSRDLRGQREVLRWKLRQQLEACYILLQEEALGPDPRHCKLPFAVCLCSCLDLLQRLFHSLPSCAEVLFNPPQHEEEKQEEEKHKALLELQQEGLSDACGPAGETRRTICDQQQQQQQQRQHQQQQQQQQQEDEDVEVQHTGGVRLNILQQLLAYTSAALQEIEKDLPEDDRGAFTSHLRTAATADARLSQGFHVNNCSRSGSSRMDVNSHRRDSSSSSTDLLTGDNSAAASAAAASSEPTQKPQMNPLPGDEQLPRYRWPFFYRMRGLRGFQQQWCCCQPATAAAALSHDRKENISLSPPSLWAFVYILQRLLRLLTTLTEALQQQCSNFTLSIRRLLQVNWVELQQEHDILQRLQSSTLGRAAGPFASFSLYGEAAASYRQERKKQQQQQQRYTERSSSLVLVAASRGQADVFLESSTTAMIEWEEGEEAAAESGADAAVVAYGGDVLDSFATCCSAGFVLREQQRRERIKAAKERQLLQWRRQRHYRRQQRKQEVLRLQKCLKSLALAVQNQLLKPLDDFLIFEELLQLHALLDPPASVLEPSSAFLLLEPDVLQQVVKPLLRQPSSPLVCRWLGAARCSCAAAAAAATGAVAYTAESGGAFHAEQEGSGAVCGDHFAASNDTAEEIQRNEHLETLRKHLHACVLQFQHPPPPLISLRLDAVQLLREVLLLCRYSFTASLDAAHTSRYRKTSMSSHSCNTRRNDSSISATLAYIGSTQQQQHRALAKDLLQSVSLLISAEAVLWMQQTPEWLYGSYFMSILPLVHLQFSGSENSGEAAAAAAAEYTGNMSSCCANGGRTKERKYFDMLTQAARAEAAQRLQLAAIQLFQVLLQIPQNEELFLGRLDMWPGSTLHTATLLQRVVLLSWSLLVSLDDSYQNCTSCYHRSQTCVSPPMTHCGSTLGNLFNITTGTTGNSALLPLYQPVELQQLLQQRLVGTEVAPAVRACLQTAIFQPGRQPKLSFLRHKVSAVKRIWNSTCDPRHSYLEKRTSTTVAAGGFPCHCFGQVRFAEATAPAVLVRDSVNFRNSSSIIQSIIRAHVLSHCVAAFSGTNTYPKKLCYDGDWPVAGNHFPFSRIFASPVTRVTSQDCVHVQLLRRTLVSCLLIITHNVRFRKRSSRHGRISVRSMSVHRHKRTVREAEDAEAAKLINKPPGQIVTTRGSSCDSAGRVLSSQKKGFAWKQYSLADDSLTCLYSKEPKEQHFLFPEILTRTWPVLLAIVGKLDAETNNGSTYAGEHLAEFCLLLKEAVFSAVNGK